MEPFEKDELSDRELDDLLPAWKAPAAPARLRAAIFRSRPWWQSLWYTSIRVPVPVAFCMAIALALAVWRWSTPVAPGVVIKTERVEVPVITERVVTRTVYRDRILRAPAAELRPVAELRPRIIRSGNAQN